MYYKHSISYERIISRNNLMISLIINCVAYESKDQLQLGNTYRNKNQYFPLSHYFEKYSSITKVEKNNWVIKDDVRVLI